MFLSHTDVSFLFRPPLSKNKKIISFFKKLVKVSHIRSHCLLCRGVCQLLKSLICDMGPARTELIPEGHCEVPGR